MIAWVHISTKIPLEKGMTRVENEQYSPGPLKPNEALVKTQECESQPTRPHIRGAGTAGQSSCKIQSNDSGMDFSGEVMSTGSNVTRGPRSWQSRRKTGQPGSMAEYTKAEIEACVTMPSGH